MCEVKVKITPVYSSIKKKSVASTLSFFTLNTKNSTNILVINQITNQWNITLFFQQKTNNLNAASLSRLHKWEAGRFQ